MIYNRLRRPDAAADRRDHPLRDRQLHAAADGLPAELAPRRTTRGSTRGCRRPRSTIPGWRRSRRPRIPAHTNYLYFVVKPCGNGEQAFASNYQQFQKLVRSSTRPPAPSAAGARPRTAETTVAASAPVSACSAGRSATAARRRCRTRRSRPSGLTGWRYQLLPVPPELFDETVGRCRRRAFAAPTSRSRTSRRRWRSPTRRRRARARSAPPTRWCSTPTGAIEADNTDAPALIAALPFSAAGQDGARARRRRQRARGRLGAARRRRGGGARLEPDARAGAQRCARELGGAPVERRRAGRPARSLHAPADWTPRRATFKQLPLEADQVDRYECVVDFVYRDSGTPLVQAARERSIPVVDGLELLVGQGALSFERFTGRPAPVDVMRARCAARMSEQDPHPGRRGGSALRQVGDRPRTSRYRTAPVVSLPQAEQPPPEPDPRRERRQPAHSRPRSASWGRRRSVAGPGHRATASRRRDRQFGGLGGRRSDRATASSERRQGESACAVGGAACVRRGEAHRDVGRGACDVGGAFAVRRAPSHRAVRWQIGDDRHHRKVSIRTFG